MVAVAVRHQDEVDLADLAEVLEFGGESWWRLMIQGSIMITLPAGRGELEGGLAVPQQFGLALGLGGAGDGEADRGDDEKKTENHEKTPRLFVLQSLASFFAAKERTFP